MIEIIPRPWKQLINRVKLHTKQWTRPTTSAIVAGSLSDLTRSRADLIAENAMLRQQLIVLKRQVKRPKLTQDDRLRLVLFARCTQFWRQALHIVQPDTLLRWHRDLFRLYWRRKSRKKLTPRIAPETIALIKRMANENRLWGAEHIRGELLKLGVELSKRTIQRYLPKERRTSGQTWATFLKSHTSHIWACDFTLIYDLLFRPLYIFVLLELKTRRIVHAAVSASPTDEWVAQQLREATPWGEGPRYLIHDRDSKYGHQFAAVAAGTGIEELKTPFRAPKANVPKVRAHCERFMGSLKRECLDHVLILHRRQLHLILQEYANYYNRFRPHQGIGQRIPSRFDAGFPVQPDNPRGTTQSSPVLGGLHHTYSRAIRLH